jgi:hypothetical protein
MIQRQTIIIKELDTDVIYLLHFGPDYNSWLSPKIAKATSKYYPGQPPVSHNGLLWYNHISDEKTSMNVGWHISDKCYPGNVTRPLSTEEPVITLYISEYCTIEVSDYIIYQDIQNALLKRFPYVTKLIEDLKSAIKYGRGPLWGAIASVELPMHDNPKKKKSIALRNYSRQKLNVSVDIFAGIIRAFSGDINFCTHEGLLGGKDVKEVMSAHEGFKYADDCKGLAMLLIAENHKKHEIYPAQLMSVCKYKLLIR